MAKLTEKQLKNAYTELDELAGIEPPVIWSSQEQFEKELYEVVVEFVTPSDKFTEATQSVFDTLIQKFEGVGQEDETDNLPGQEDEVEKEKPEPEPIPEPIPEPKKKVGNSKKKTEPKPKPESKKEVEPKPEKPKKTDVPEGLTRADNFAQIYAEGVPYTKKEWIKKMHELYPGEVKNDVGARLHFNVYSKLLISLGKMKVTEDGKYVKA